MNVCGVDVRRAEVRLGAWILVLATILAGGLCMSFPTAARAVPPPPDYFPLKTGYWWKYKATNLSTNASSEWTLKVMDVEKTDKDLFYRVEVEAGQMKYDEWYSKPRGWVLKHRILYLSNQMKADYTPVDKYLMNPPSTGATWDWSGKGMMDVEATHKEVVKGSETVVVPAGKFVCQRVETDTVQGGQNVHKTYWYANWIGIVKSITESGGIKNQSELLDYSFRPKH